MNVCKYLGLGLHQALSETNTYNIQNLATTKLFHLNNCSALHHTSIDLCVYVLCVCVCARACLFVCTRAHANVRIQIETWKMTQP